MVTFCSGHGIKLQEYSSAGSERFPHSSGMCVNAELVKHAAKTRKNDAHFLKERVMDKLDMLQSEISSLRMVVAIDSAMLLSVVRRMNGDQLALASKDFLEVCEGLSIKTLFSEMDDHSIQSAQKRRDWWIGLLAEIVANEAVTQPLADSPRPPA